MNAIPYTLRSFIELAESGDRRGKDISRIDAGVRRATRALGKRRDRFRLEVAGYSLDDPARGVIRDAFREDRQELRRARDQAVEAAMHAALITFEEKLSIDEFTFALRAGPLVGGKPTFQIDSTLDIEFPAKQASDAVKRAASIEAPSRNSIVRALKAALGKKYAHAVYRLDIKEFFESIPHSTLLDRLSNFPDLDSVSVLLAKRLLKEFEVVQGRNVGLPRGVGLSSQLAELYLSDFDTIVKTHPGVLFYARYVDDVVVVLESEQALGAVKRSVVAELDQLELVLNQDKTRELITCDTGDYRQGAEIEYLGYRFDRSDGKLTIGLTDKRRERRVQRLSLTIDSWLGTLPNAAWPNHGHNGLLLDRMRYLAGNTKLLNSKSNVAIGLYFSNSALDEDAKELAELDELFVAFRNQHAPDMPEKLQARLAEISFTKMFASKEFLRFRQKRVEQIVRIWVGVN